MDHLTRYVSEGGVLDIEPKPALTFGSDLSMEVQFNRSRLVPVVDARIGSSSFTVEYVYRDSKYFVRGRILEGADSRLVLLRCECPPAPAWLLVPYLLVTALFLQYAREPLQRAFAFVSLAMTLTGAVLRPSYGYIPSEFVDGVGVAFSTCLRGTEE